MFLHPAPVSTGPCVRATRRVAPALVALALLLLPSAARADITTGLIGYWKFDEGRGTTIADSSGQGHTATLAGTTLPSFVTGKSGKALSFDGISSYVVTNNVDLSGTNKASVSVWLKKASYTGGAEIIFEFSPNYNTSTDTFTAFFLGNFVGGVKGDVGYNYKFFTNPSVNIWHNLVSVYDKSESGANEIQYYLDGVLQTLTSQPASNDNTNNFGNRQLYLMMRGGTSLPTAGIMDEVRLYNRALTAADVTQLYNQYALPMDGLVAWWTFDEGSGTTVKDPIGNNSGTLSGATKPTFVTGKTGKALSFDGSFIPYVSLGSPDTLNLQNAAFTVSAWVKTNGQPTSGGDKNQPVISRQNGSAGTTYTYLFRLTPTFVPEMAMWDGVHALNAQGSALTTDMWYHIVSVYGGVHSQIFVNGVAGTAVAKGAYINPSYPNSPAYIGAWAAQIGGRGHFNGLIDDVRIYNRALSAAEVVALYRAGSGPAARGFNRIKGASSIRF